MAPSTAAATGTPPRAGRAFLREAGYEVEIATEWNGEPADFMIALHARRSFKSIHAFAKLYPERPLIVVLTCNL